MIIGVLAGSESNLYPAVLIQMLAVEGYPVSFVVCIKTDSLPIKVFKAAISGCLLRKAGKVLQSRQSKVSENAFLMDFMKEKGIVTFGNLKALSKILQFQLLTHRNINSAMCTGEISRFGPDILVYCGGGILRAPLLRTARIGVLNAHMGLLPQYRGMNVLEWSLFNDDPVGVTIHFINEGIDTGEILLKREMKFNRGDTILSLRHRSVILNLKLLIEAIQLIDHGNAQPLINPLGEGKQYFTMHPLLKEYVETRLSNRCS